MSVVPRDPHEPCVSLDEILDPPALGGVPCLVLNGCGLQMTAYKVRSVIRKFNAFAKSWDCDESEAVERLRVLAQQLHRAVIAQHGPGEPCVPRELLDFSSELRPRWDLGTNPLFKLADQFLVVTKFFEMFRKAPANTGRCKHFQQLELLTQQLQQLCSGYIEDPRARLERQTESVESHYQVFLV